MNDGQPHYVTGDMATIMAGLACGEPNIISWPIIRTTPVVLFPPMIVWRCVCAFLPRCVCALIRLLFPGESGAIGVGLLL